jgi:mobilization protein NikA
VAEGGTPQRTIRVSDEDWAEIERRAKVAGMDRTSYLLRRALAPDRVDRGALTDIRRLSEQITELACGAMLKRRR